MYLNTVCMKCGRVIPFQSVVPYSVDKIAEGWNLITDEVNGQIISIRGSEIASVCSQDCEKLAKSPEPKKNTTKKKNGSKTRLSVSTSDN